MQPTNPQSWSCAHEKGALKRGRSVQGPPRSGSVTSLVPAPCKGSWGVSRNWGPASGAAVWLSSRRILPPHQTSCSGGHPGQDSPCLGVASCSIQRQSPCSPSPHRFTSAQRPSNSDL